MDSKNNRTPVHLVCPKCYYEYEYDHAGCDARIRVLGQEIFDITSQMQVRKRIENRKDPAYTDWLKRARHALAQKQKELANLKEYRKVANVQVKATELELFAQIVREHVPFDTYVQWHEEAQGMMQYRTYDTAVQRHNNFANA